MITFFPIGTIPFFLNGKDIQDNINNITNKVFKLNPNAKRALSKSHDVYNLMVNELKNIALKRIKTNNEGYNEGIYQGMINHYEELFERYNTDVILKGIIPELTAAGVITLDESLRLQIQADIFQKKHKQIVAIYNQKSHGQSNDHKTNEEEEKERKRLADMSIDDFIKELNKCDKKNDKKSEHEEPKNCINTINENGFKKEDDEMLINTNNTINEEETDYINTGNLTLDELGKLSQKQWEQVFNQFKKEILANEPIKSSNSHNVDQELQKK